MEKYHNNFNELSHDNLEIEKMNGCSMYRIELVATELLRPNECTSLKGILQLRNKVLSEGLWKTPILVETSSFSILDGHHRTEVAKLLGLTKVPVVMVDYSDSRLCLSARRDDVLVSPEEVIRRSKSGDFFPWKTTKHVLSPGVQETSIPLSELYGNSNNLN